MHEIDERMAQDDDPLAEIIRAAGRRSSPPKAHYDEVYAAARTAWRNKVRSRRKRRWLALAASIAVISAAAALFGLLDTGQLEQAARLTIARGSIERFSEASQSWERIGANGMALTVGTRLRTGNDGGLALALSRGGSLRLGSDTEIVLGAAEQTLRAGRIYFDSAGRSAEAAIEVLTPLGRLREVGTQFELRVEPSLLRLRVREGEVALHPSVSASELTALAGDEIAVTAEGDTRRSAIAPDHDEWDWAVSLASVPENRSRSILLYLRWIARETGKRLEFESPILEITAEAATLTGDPTGLSPVELLENIEATSAFVFNLTADGAILIGRSDDR